MDEAGGEQSVKESSASGGERRRYFLIAAACAAGFGIAELLRVRGVLVPANVFLPLHTLLEMSSIVVGFAVFTTGWFGYRQTGNTRELYLGVVFLAAGAIILLHTLTFGSMPELAGVSGGTTTAFFIAARLIAGLGLFTASFVVPRSRSRFLSPAYLLAGAAVVVTLVVALVLRWAPESIAVGHTSILPKALELVVLGLYVMAFFAISEKRGWEPDTVFALRCAVLVGAFAELAFAVYVHQYSLLNSLGHLLKTTSYYLILAALFLSAIRRPYQQLSDAKEEVQRLYADAEEHRKEVEHSFARIGSALSSSLRLNEALDQIAGLAMDILRADCSIVTSISKHQHAPEVSAQRGDTHVPGRAIEVALIVGKMAIDSGKSSIIENDLKSSGWIECSYTFPNCLRSIVCAPMFHEGEALGVIAIYSHKFGAFEGADGKLLEAFASHAAVAIHNAMSYERETKIADVLQRPFLSPVKMVIDGFEIAQVYVAAMEEAKVGGDFYDVFELGDGRIALVIGDVSGKGLDAAVHTAMAKYSLRAYLSEGHGPAAALTRLDKTVGSSVSMDTFITLFCGILDTHARELVYASAGHEPALYSANGGCVEMGSTGPVLGVGFGWAYAEKTLSFDKDGALLLYTDGISEARKGKDFLGTEGIRQHLLTCREGGSEEIAKCIYRSALDFAGGELRDDAAILVVKAL